MLAFIWKEVGARAVERRKWRRVKQKASEERRGLIWLYLLLHVLLQLLA